MKFIYKLLCAVVFLIAAPQILFGQKVYSVKYSSQAKVKVFVVKYESQADLCVYKVDYESQAGKNDGCWYCSI